MFYDMLINRRNNIIWYESKIIENISKYYMIEDRIIDDNSKYYMIWGWNNRE